MITEFFKEYFDFKTLFLVLALIAIGIVSIYSATYGEETAALYYQKQLTWFGIGACAMLITLFIPFRAFPRVAIAFYAISLLLLVIVLIIGKTISGSTSWLGVGGIGAQPSEIAKIGTILALAAYMSKSDVDLLSMKHLAITFGILAVPVVLIVLQPDAGTAITYCGMFLPMLAWGGASPFLILFIAACIVVSLAALFGTTMLVLVFALFAVVLYFFRVERFRSVLAFSGVAFLGMTVQLMIGSLPPHQQKRLTVFLNPESELLGAGYNVFQSKVAIGSGGLLGKGFLQGTQTQFNFIPEQWTDFIFCVPGEEFGFLGSAVVLSLFLMLLLRNVRLALLLKNRFASLTVMGITSIFFVHIAINVGMAMGLFPVVGVPLPFLSYGGSALLANMVMVGLLMNLYIHRKEY
jgi:rod shape determining protein RodA